MIQQILAVGAAFVVALLATFLGSDIPADVYPEPREISVVDGETFTPLALPDLTETFLPPTSTPVAPLEEPDEVVVEESESALPLPEAEVPVSAAVTATTSPDFEDIALSLKNASVNILCISKDGDLKSTTGSGVIIDSRGLILTASHIAQQYLIADYPAKNSISCTIRTGSPATTAYKAALVYVSPSWIEHNPDTLVTKKPRGTGEHDFAVLAITESATKKPLPLSFPAVFVSSLEPKLNEPVIIGGYGAQELTGKDILSSLFPTIIYGSVKERYTFEKRTIDVISVGGNAAAQQGSSGGGIVNEKGEVIGVITTSSVTGDYETRDLHAITTGHIFRSYKADTGRDFRTYLSSNALSTLIGDFKNEAEPLRQILITAIKAAD